MLPAEQFVGQVQPPDAEVGGDDSGRQVLLAQPRGDLDAEAVVAEEHVADPRDEHLLTHRGSSTSGSTSVVVK